MAPAAPGHEGGEKWKEAQEKRNGPLKPVVMLTSPASPDAWYTSVGPV